MKLRLDHRSSRISFSLFSGPAALALSIGVACLVGGCEKEPELPDVTQDKELQASETPPAKSTDEDPKTIDDERLEHAVLHRLFLAGVFPEMQVDVEAKDGVIKLSGTALSLGSKRLAESVVRHTKGVSAVVDKLVVEAPEVPDSVLQQRVEDALLFDPATESYEVEVEVEDGVAKLTGTVDSWAEFTLAGDVAASVKGVVDIDNQIKIAPPVVRANGEIKRDIENRLANDVLVDTELLSVSVDGGVVTLDGVVGSAAEKERAIAKSWVAGVRRVKADDLQVEWWNRDRFERAGADPNKPDVEIKKAVENALEFDDRIQSEDVEVYVDRGRVTLTGSVPSLRDWRMAEQTARDTFAVERVRNYLEVEPEEEFGDEELKARVERALSLNPYLSDWTGEVIVNDGAVTLEGKVNNEMEKRQAQAVAERTLGVEYVNNDLEVFIHDIADLALEDDIEEQLFWNVYVDQEDVEVSVDRGMVTLTGTVDDLRAYRAAADTARAAGAEVVYNKLDIEEKKAS